MLQPGFSAHYLITSHVTICPGQSHHDMLHLPEAILESDHAVDLRCAFCSNAWHVSCELIAAFAALLNLAMTSIAAVDQLILTDYSTRLLSTSPRRVSSVALLLSIATRAVASSALKAI
jgi:hypothetical protein